MNNEKQELFLENEVKTELKDTEKKSEQVVHPTEELLRKDRLPHIWCSGCGLGAALQAFIGSIIELKLDPKNLAVISGIGCTGRIAGYVKFDGYHTTHGRAVPFATGLKLAKPEMKVIVFSGDGDIVAIGGNHLIHAARRNLDICILCVNNFNYGMTGGQIGPTTPLYYAGTTAPYGSCEQPFNLVKLAASSGATYVARWSTLDIRRLITAMKEAIMKKGFSFVEIISPCPSLFGRKNKLGEGIDFMRMIQKLGVVKNGASPDEAEISLDGKIVFGKFVDIEKKTYFESYVDILKKYNFEIPERIKKVI